VIELPRRSVTRFFIPLIDVLTLLFCIFLLMPYVKPAEGEAPETAGERDQAPAAGEAKSDAEKAEASAREADRMRRERDRLAREKDQVLERLTVRVLEVDRDTGKLYYYDPERVEIASQSDAQKLIDRERRKAGARELYFLFLFPREVTGYPLQRQVTDYERWFAGMPHGFDNPRGSH
jgi:hypothetical protein